MIIPIRTETPIHRTPTANYLLLAVNFAMFLVLDTGGSMQLAQFKDRYLLLHAAVPSLHEFITYQFVHGDGAHLLGNMLFLWVFGNAVNAKMGNVPYLLYYLASGVFAAVAFSLTSMSDLLGASGAIAGVTTAYLVLFPRSHVTVLYFMFFIGTFELPAMLLIGLKIILWDNILAPQMGSAGNVAFSAHLAGYAFGILIPLVMLWLRALPRDQFDMLALVKRWKQRQEYRANMSDPAARAEAEFGRVARPIPASPQQLAAEEARLDRIGGLRARIAECLDRGDLGAASTLYEQLVEIDANQCLSVRHQIGIGREFYATGRPPQAAAAFERFLVSYGGSSSEADEVRLLLGIIYARDLHQYEAAERYLTAAKKRITDPARIAQCEQWLADVRKASGKAPPSDGPVDSGAQKQSEPQRHGDTEEGN